MHLYRTREGASKGLAVFALIMVIAEAGANTYLTSCPTVSRTTYLSNYSSYQILTDRTAEKERHSFFRFEKFARRTQNDAMLIGFQGGSYFSSVLNSRVADFYERYGMRGSRINYCYDGATPVTAAILSNKYMLYTLDRGYDNLFELADREGQLYLYQNNYSVPFGFVITDIDDAYDDEHLNPIQRQNRLVNRLGIDGEVFVSVEFDLYGNFADFYAPESAHYYAYTNNTKIDTIEMNYDGRSKTFSNIGKKYILDVGYHERGELVTLESDNGESLGLSIYMVNEGALKRYVDMLRQQTMTVEDYDETHILGSINISEAGQLVLSVPYDAGWTLSVDSAETDIDLFEDTFISVYLTEGEHTIALSYYPEGFTVGVMISVVCVLVFAAVCLRKYFSNPRQSLS